MYHSSKGMRFKKVHEAHERLGPVVRISSNHVSFTEPSAYKGIYNYGSKIVKDDFYETIADGNPSMAQTASKIEHGNKRRNLAHVFAAQQVTSVEPRILEAAQKLCRNIETKSQEGTFNLRPWLNMFSFDAITSMFWSNSYSFLDSGNDLCSTELSSGKVIHVNAMHSYQSAVHFNVIWAHLPRGWYQVARKVLSSTFSQRAGDYFSGMAKWLVKERLRSNPTEPDLFSSLPITASEKRPVPMTFDQVHAECTTMLDAGNDTTQISLTNCTYQLARYPKIQAKLRSALNEVLPKSDAPACYADLQHIPYLRAVLDESFRVRTPLAFGLPRKVVEPGVVISGHEIYPGTTISAPLYTLHRNETLFKDATAFIPERWLPNDSPLSQEYLTSETEAKNLKEYVLPFSLGGRACIGRNLAFMELSIVIAALVRGFEWELTEPGWEMQSFERFNCGNIELLVRAKKISFPNAVARNEAI
jgi:benzoate 4-monooxygenase